MYLSSPSSHPFIHLPGPVHSAIPTCTCIYLFISIYLSILYLLHRYLENIYEISKVVLKYGLFALCVLVINKLRRHHMQQRRMRRQRLSSSSNSSDDGQLLQQVC